MIRDGDGKDPKKLKQQLCMYYKDREKQDRYQLPRVQERNVLILKYYSFENYFLEPSVLTQIGVISSEEEFFRILYAKYKEYLYRLSSTQHMLHMTGIKIKSAQDLKDHFEEVKTFVRGHNLFDIFYGSYKKERLEQVLTNYIEKAPKETFDDILSAIDAFVYFDNKKVK